MAKKYKALIYTRDLELLKKLEEAAAPTELSFYHLDDMVQMIQAVYDDVPHVIIAELRPSNIAGFDICNQVKTDPILSHIPLVIIQDGEGEQSLIESCADVSFKAKQTAEALLDEARQILSVTSHELDINPLTQLPGSRSSMNELEAAFVTEELFCVCSVHVNYLDLVYPMDQLEKKEIVIRRLGELIREIITELKSARLFIGHPAVEDFLIIMDPDCSVEFAERLIERFEQSIKTGIQRRAGANQHPVTVTIAIATNEDAKFRHVVEMTKSCDQIHGYLRRFSHSAYLKDRRINTRDIDEVEMPSDLPDLKKGQTADGETPMRRRGGVDAGYRYDVIFFLKSQRITIFYQPIVTMLQSKKDSPAFGFEALARFRRMDGSMANPQRMFTVAREMNLVKELDILCARAAIDQAGELIGRHMLFINMNRETLMDSGVMKGYLQFLAPMERSVVFELTEQSLVRQSRALLQCLDLVRDKGIKIALDDAGGGSVSLRDAADLKPDFIKYDRTLVRNVNQAATKQKILMSLMVFSKGIGAETVAEGIETWEEWEFLHSMGIEYAQGFWIAKPNLAEKMAEKYRDAPETKKHNRNDVD